jgi:hypothetical protein
MLVDGIPTFPTSPTVLLSLVELFGRPNLLLQLCLPLSTGTCTAGFLIPILKPLHPKLWGIPIISRTTIDAYAAGLLILHSTVAKTSMCPLGVAVRPVFLFSITSAQIVCG